MPVLRRIVNDVSYVTKVNHESLTRIDASLFALQASSWWCWGMRSLAPRIVNDMSCVTDINHETAFCVAGAVFGEVGD